MESTMDRNSVESRLGDAMSIFGQGIDVRRPGRSRRRATQKNLSPEIEQPVKPSMDRLHQRRAVAEREQTRAESELSRTRTMAKELERQIEQTSAKARSHRWELQGTRASGSGRKKGLADVEAPGVDHPQEINTLYVEVMQELDRVKREIRKLLREVKSATEAKAKAERDAETPTLRVMSSDSRVPDSGKREAGEANEDRAIAELAEAGGFGKGMQMQATRTRAKGLHRDTSSESDTEERFATASSSDVGLRDAEMAMVPATETDHVENDEWALTITQHDDSSLQAAEAELHSARIELECIKEEGLRFVNSIERTRKETARVAEEISRLKEQEKKASAQVQQLDAKLFRARSRLEAATAADESAEAMLAELSAALKQLGEETEVAEKEKALTELENRCVREDAENVSAEIAAAEQRVRESVRELEAARASEAAATEKLKAVVDSAMLARAAVTSQRSGNATIPRFEYEYLTGRADVVRAVAEKKVSAAQAWVEALRAGEKEMAMRAEAIEREIGETMAGQAETAGGHRATGHEPRDGPQQRDAEATGAQRERGAGGVGSGKDTVIVNGAEDEVTVVQHQEEEEGIDTEVPEAYRGKV
ncbi:protein PLASTID MOVEMENT IMPAIRED 2-like [Phragmites australis]|uniref:protein PLASTID MOVEMENT IMPAIRED 2-like n=1 Tax=Phragmites australis TaxID=29695 RepID=UPI002D78EEA0|nr:protein PLASTID MOVEMENT IMPAIRED 2-like [Phragmites australis]